MKNELIIDDFFPMVVLFRDCFKLCRQLEALAIIDEMNDEIGEILFREQ